MNSKIYRFIDTNKDILAAIMIFTSIVSVLGFFFTNWGFLHDDFGVVWHISTSFDNLLKLFIEPGMTCVYQPSNFHMPEQSFFAVLYRPFSCIFYALQFKIFSFSAYGYFLTTIMLHACNAVLFFFLLRSCIPFTAAFLATLYFGFHISFWEWMGWISGQEHVINFTLILIIIHLLKYHLDSKKMIPLFGALLFFLISLFTRETAIFFPLWLPFAVSLYRKYNTPQISAFHDVITITCSFFSVSALYLGIRCFMYPIKTQGQGIKVILNPIDFFFNLKNRFFDAVTFLADSANLSWLSGGHRLFKGSLMTLFIVLCITLFIHNRKKGLFLFFILSGFLFMWPALLRYYSSRYLYKTMAFFIVGGLCLITYFKSSTALYTSRIAKITGYAMVCIIMANALLLAFHMKHREHDLHVTEQAFKELLLNPTIINRNLCFVALPNDRFITGVAQALWMFGYDKNKQIYYDQATFVGYKNQPSGNNLSITKHDNQLHFISCDQEKIWFCDPNPFTRMGTITIKQRNEGENVVDMCYTFDQEWSSKNLLFVTWDYQTSRFVILDL